MCHSYLKSLLATAAAAQILGVSESFLAKARMRGTGPRYRKLGRTVRYLQPDSDQWLRSCCRSSTAEQGRRAEDSIAVTAARLMKGKR